MSLKTSMTVSEGRQPSALVWVMTPCASRTPRSSMSASPKRSGSDRSMTAQTPVAVSVETDVAVSQVAICVPAIAIVPANAAHIAAPRDEKENPEVWSSLLPLEVRGIVDPLMRLGDAASALAPPNPRQCRVDVLVGHLLEGLFSGFHGSWRDRDSRIVAPRPGSIDSSTS